MQKPHLIPTPLVARNLRPVELVPQAPPGVLRVFWIVGFIVRISFLWWRTTLALRFTGRASTRATMNEVRTFLERMGGLWVKAGQIVAMRRDIFHPETCDVLSALQDRARGFSFDLVRKSVESELGATIEDLFSEFDPQPIAAASIGQTHEARVRATGVRVAVKVQRPFIDQSFTHDLRYLRFVIFWLNRFSVAPQARWSEMAWELEKALGEELDYRMEASALGRMRKRLRKHGIYAPKVFHELSSRRVLVMEFVEGVFMSDYINVAQEDPKRLASWLAENDIEPRKVGERLYISHIRQLFEDNLYHGDLHPGNILLQKKSRVVLIDFGTVGSFDKSLLRKHDMMFQALAERDYGKVADMFLLMCPPLPNRDMAEIKGDITRAIRTWEARTMIERLPYHEKSFTALSSVFAQLLGKYAVPSNWEFLRLNRSDLTLDASLMYLLPGINYPKLYRKYLGQAKARALMKASKPQALRETVEGLMAAAKLPAMLAENLYFDAQWARSRALAFEGKISKLAYTARGAISFFAYATLAIGFILFGQYLRMYQPGRFGFLETPWANRFFDALPAYRREVWIAVALAAAYALRQLTSIRRYVDEKEYERPGR